MELTKLIDKLNELVSSQLTAYCIAMISEGHISNPEVLSNIEEFANHCSESSKLVMKKIIDLGGDLKYITNGLRKDGFTSDLNQLEYFDKLSEKLSKTYRSISDDIKSDISSSYKISDICDMLYMLETQANDLHVRLSDCIVEYKKEVGDEIMRDLRQLMANKGKEAKRMMLKGNLNNPNMYLNELLRSNHVYGMKDREDFSMIFSMNFADEWSGDVETGWAPPEGLFTKSAEEIAKVLIDNSKDLSQAMSRLNFYINRAGSNLSPERKSELEKAKDLLRKEE